MRKFAQTPRLPKLVPAVLLLAALPITPAARASTRLLAAACEEPVPTRTYDGNAMTYGVSVDLSGCWWWDGSPIRLEASLSRLDGTGEEGSTAIVVCGERMLGERQHGEDDQAVDDEKPSDDPKSDDNDSLRDDASGSADARPAPEGDTTEQDDATGDDTSGSPGEGDDVRDDGWSHVASAPDDAPSRRTTCEVSTALEHPSAEVARYRGEITYPWRDGPETISFSAVCASPGSVCRDA